MRFALALAALAGQDGLEPGLVGEYWHLGRPLLDFPEFTAGEKPRFKRVDSQIAYKRADGAFGGTKLRDYYFVRWTGVVRVPRNGKITFFTESDDGSRLFIDGKAVVKNGGVHEMREERGEVNLKAGDHAIRVEFFDNFGHAGCVVSWEAEGMAKAAIPAEALFHRKSATPKEEELKGIELAVSDRIALKEVGEKVEGKPPAEGAFAVDEKIVPKGAKPPDVVGRVTDVFKDGAVTMVMVRTSAAESPIFIREGTPLTWHGIADSKPAAGQMAYVWLKAGSKDAAAKVAFAKD